MVWSAPSPGTSGKVAGTAYQAKKGRERLLLCKIAGCTEDNNHGVFLELDGAAGQDWSADQHP